MADHDLSRYRILASYVLTLNDQEKKLSELMGYMKIGKVKRI